ncbi:MAG TPA: hypothetical protein VK528_05500 [Flavobacterium sp.]|nr:hypothetical protein [Flavobacterium sp.]
MKKKLEAELISIAHRILKLKNKSDLIQLHQETQKLYEKLSVLRFVEENFADVKPTIGYTEIEDKLAVIFDTEIPAEEPKQEEPKAKTATRETETPKAAEPIEIEPTEAKAEEKKTALSSVSEEIEKSGKAIADLIKGIRGNSPEKVAEEKPADETKEEPVSELDSSDSEQATQPEETMAEAEATEETTEAENIPEPIAEAPKSEETDKDDFFKPAFELSFEPKAEESKPVGEAKITPAQIAFDDLLGQSYKDPVFVKPEDLDTENEVQKTAEKSDVIPISRSFVDNSNVISINKSENLNDRISKGITIGLNDRVAFMSHLFNNSSEDYNRVLSQLITLDTLSEAKNFIDTMVKPDYNNWEGKEDYEQRFMEIIEKKFS